MLVVREDFILPGWARPQPAAAPPHRRAPMAMVSPMSFEDQDQESLRARSEQAIGELAQALLDSQVLENAVAAAFGAREKAVEAQHAALAALNVPTAGEVERLERRLRSVSQRLEEVEDEFDRVSRELGGLRRQLAASRAEEEASEASKDQL